MRGVRQTSEPDGASIHATASLARGHTCVFAGAGCSRALFGMPVQAELVDEFVSWDNQGEHGPHLSQSVRQPLCAMKDIELVVSHCQNLEGAWLLAERMRTPIQDMRDGLQCDTAQFRRSPNGLAAAA